MGLLHQKQERDGVTIAREELWHNRATLGYKQVMAYAPSGWFIRHSRYGRAPTHYLAFVRN
jgi:hypothetical protein